MMETKQPSAYILLTGSPLTHNHLYGQTKGGGRYMKKDGKVRKEAYQWEARAQYRGAPIQGAVHADIRMYFENELARDNDNALKIVFDCLEGIVLKNDNQITDHSAKRRLDKKNPRVEIMITPYDCSIKERLQAGDA